MEVIQKSKYSSFRLKRFLDAYGGRYTFREAVNLGGIGVAGMRYGSGISKVDDFKGEFIPRTAIELLRDGINFHVMIQDDSMWVMYTYEEILAVIIEKPADTVHYKEGFTFFNYLTDKGLAYPWARVFLLEDEIGELHDPTINLTTTAGESLSLKITRKDYRKVIRFLEKSPLQEKLVVQVEEYRI